MSDFAQLKAALRAWPAGDWPAQPVASLPLERLRKTLAAGTAAGPGDIASLVRHVLRHESVQHGSVQKLTLPSAPPFPSLDQWTAFGFKVRETEGGRREVEAGEWQPAWLPPLAVGGAEAGPFHAAEAAQVRRPDGLKTPADPAWQLRFGTSHYLSSSQAEAVRAVMLSPNGSVRLVILPTGAGKSRVGLSAALLGQAELGGTSVIVVPTIALAYDQVKSARESHPGLTIDAWEAGMAEEDKRAVRERLNAGTQRLLFAAPESIVGALSGALCRLAENGALQAFIVDEVHLVSQWGGSFRPDFQLMSALWRELRDRCPQDRVFRTLLMTATLSAETFADLDVFFGPLGEAEILAAVHLRPEPDYFQARCIDNDEKIARVLETLRHAPRPAILYVTTKEDARAWHQRCLNQGWRRTGLVHGDCSSAEREAAVIAWRDDKLDLMVATSAFGLGMDKGDVRLVLHACVPETVDRFYQEVGRGGRDGVASSSIMLWTDKDRSMAARMSLPATISNELGLDRWRSMWNDSRTQKQGEVCLVNLRAVRPGLEWDSDVNEEWNLRTVLLLARAGVLELHHHSPPPLPDDPGGTEDQRQASREAHWEKYASLCPVKLLRNNPLSEADWEHSVHQHRRQSQENGARNWRRMEDILTGARPLAEVLREIYLVPAAGIHHVGLDSDEVTLVVPTEACATLKEVLRAATGGARMIIVTYRSDDEKRAMLMVETLRRSSALGIREFALPAAWRDLPRWPGTRLANPLEDMLRKALEKFIVVRDVDDKSESYLSPMVRVPRLSLLSPGHATHPIPDHLLTLDRPLHVIVAPEECPDHLHPHRFLRDGPHMRLETFYRLLQQ